MKGIVLAGGLGSRLHPLTKITNKHLLPIYDKPMIYYPIQTLVDAGIKEIMIVTGGNNAGDFLKLLGNGSHFGLKHLNFTYQAQEGGIAEAVGLCEYFAGGEKVIIILGDNLIQKNLKKDVDKFEKQQDGAMVFLKRVRNPGEYGVAETNNKKIIKIIEKPRKPKSDLAVIGVYLYDNRVFDIIKTLKPSRRGELEITDVNNAYISRGEMSYSILKGGWADAGESIDAYNNTINFVRRYWKNKTGKRSGK
ncbi:MAG: NTP transferase domain-containing protein [candidate division Zixibacteria bacterium]|nr:NTP transferase domain-containing protein [candidate division Zixibacteria bacterium]